MIKKSDISELMYYYDKDSPENIANAIMDIDFNKHYDSESVIKMLDAEFNYKISKLIK